MPKLEFVRTAQEAKELNFRFWHVVIKMKRPWFFQLSEIDGSKVIAKVVDASGEFKQRRLAWRSDRGPFSSSGKVEADEEYFIPIAAKSTGGDSVSLDAVNGKYILRWKAAYITDAAGLVHGNEVDTQASYQRDSLPPGEYKVELEIRKGLKRVDSGNNTFTLSVPADLNNLDGFKLSR